MQITDISKVTDYLYVGSKVGKEKAEELKELNFNLIISMIGQMPPDEIYTLPPFKTLWIKTYDTFFSPISINKLLDGVKAALPIIQNKGKVLVFCMQGKEISVTSSRTQVVQCDGEILEKIPHHIKIIPEAIKVLVPKKS